mmetsp:Transcript_96609/g.273129  ORF Transcript_96609/g.273129 Transcript_96609/m.273129 type:complete len:283 (+) Transcript_96609:144-992(+)
MRTLVLRHEIIGAPAHRANHIHEPILLKIQPVLIRAVEWPLEFDGRPRMLPSRRNQFCGGIYLCLRRPISLAINILDASLRADPTLHDVSSHLGGWRLDPLFRAAGVNEAETKPTVLHIIRRHPESDFSGLAVRFPRYSVIGVAHPAIVLPLDHMRIRRVFIHERVVDVCSVGVRHALPRASTGSAAGFARACHGRDLHDSPPRTIQLWRLVGSKRCLAFSLCAGGRRFTLSVLVVRAIRPRTCEVATRDPSIVTAYVRHLGIIPTLRQVDAHAHSCLPHDG